MALSPLRTFLLNLVRDELGVTAVWANQNLPKLKKPFATLRLLGSKEATFAESRPSGSYDGKWRKVTPIEAVLELQLFGTKGTFPYDELEHLVGRLSVNEVVDRCFAEGIAIYDAEAVQDISGLLDDNLTLEPRAAVDLHIRHMKVLDDTKDYIEQVQIQGAYDDTDPGSGEDGQGGSDISSIKAGGHLIYGHIAEDGTVTDLDHAIPVNVSVSISDD